MTSARPSYLPLFYVFLSGFGFSIQGMVIKRLSEAGFDASFAIIFLRGVIQVRSLRWWMPARHGRPS